VTWNPKKETKNTFENHTQKTKKKRIETKQNNRNRIKTSSKNQIKN
jgi:hypothetical protein